MSDIDLGFTPARNTNALRRMDLSEGASAAWRLVTEDWTVKRLQQRYYRTGAKTFDYVSTQNKYRSTLVTDDFGAMIEYPGLWTMLCRD